MKSKTEKLLDELVKLHPKYIDLSLDRLKLLLKKLDNPQNHLPKTIHIAGTNGKGSVQSFIRNILLMNGYKCDAYISPHLSRFNERIILNDKEVSTKKLYETLIFVKKIKMYPEEIVKPMKLELTNSGFSELTSSEDVKSALKKEGTTLIVVNSVCGCAARNARPGVIMSLSNESKPDNLCTVFAGFDIEATNTAREEMLPFPPSSPSIALFKDGELVHMVERHHIEGREADLIADNLIQAYNEFC